MVLYIINDGSMMSIRSCGVQSFVALRKLRGVPVRWSAKSKGLHLSKWLTTGALSCLRFLWLDDRSREGSS